MNKMYHYISWFQNNYEELHQEMLECNHNFDHKNLNPYHLESDCWSHTMMVCKIAEIQGYDKVVQIAALLHDIGKPKARVVNLVSNRVKFFGHEKLSTEMSRDILNHMVSEEMISVDEMNDILIIILHHGNVYKNDEQTMCEILNNNKRLYKLLMQLSYCDNLGRFTAGTNV